MSWFPVLQCREEHNIQPRWGKCGFGSCHRTFFKMIIYRCLILDISFSSSDFILNFKYKLCGVPFKKYIYTRFAYVTETRWSDVVTCMAHRNDA